LQNDKRAAWKHKDPTGRNPVGSCVKAGDDLLSPWTDYHRPRVLNGRVRDGNGCGHSGLVTGSTVLGRPLGRASVYGGFLYDSGGKTLQLYSFPTGAGEWTERPSDRLLVSVS
jgi:hypothetical protein